LVEEVFALTDDRHPYVYLSDGGHFDNLGVYEMIRRRCRLVVACDAGADRDCTFDDLGNALRKVSIDLGVRVTFNGPIEIYPRSATEKFKAFSRCQGYCALGEIHYAPPGCTPEEARRLNGWLLYVKAAFYGTGEPADVYNYAQQCRDFPHESTADQFFSESQFESYRALGEHVGNAVREQLRQMLDEPQGPRPQHGP